MSRVILKEAKPVTKTDQITLTESVSTILRAVQKEGDQALFRFTKEFDRCERLQIQVSHDEKTAALRQVSEQDLADIQFAANNIREFAQAQRDTLVEIDREILPGVHLGHRVIPLDSVGVYIPGGRYPLPSSALMGIIPARTAGVKRIAACAPPDPKTGVINAHTLVAMQVAGADEIYCVGGAQAIGGLAYGTQSILPVEMIVGPGNAYVTEAKRQVYGQVAIDFLAGPSEGLVLADEFANPQLIAADLLAQCEHDLRARSILVTTSKDLVNQVLADMEGLLTKLETAEIAHHAWETNGCIYLVSDLEEGIDVANELAPEHLEVHISDWQSIWKKLTNYGSLFLGEDAPIAFGDYCSGTNHILPTMGTARLHGGLWTGMFLKVATHQWVTPEGAEQLAPVTDRFASLEGLAAHALSARMRSRKQGMD